jgi:WD40 repeat protein
LSLSSLVLSEQIPLRWSNRKKSDLYKKNIFSQSPSLYLAPAVLVSATGDGSLKIWDLQRGEHHLIQPSENCQMTKVSTNINSRIVAAAGGANGVLFWSCSRDKSGQINFEQKKSAQSQTASHISWFQKASISPLIAVADGKVVSILQEQTIQEASAKGLHVIQVRLSDKTLKNVMWTVFVMEYSSYYQIVTPEVLKKR